MLLGRPLLLLLTLSSLAGAQSDYGLFFGRGGTVRVAEASLPVGLEALTVECWIRATTKVRKPMDLVAQWSEEKGAADAGSFRLALTGGDRVGFWLRSATDEVANVSAAGKWTVGEWVHLAATWDGDALALLVNGREIAREETPGFGALAESALPLVLGPDADGSRRPARFEGFLGGVDLWSTARSPVQVQGSFEGAPLEDDSGLFASYDLRAEAPVDRAEDVSSSGRDAVLTDDLARAGWARSRGWYEEEAPSVDLFAYDLADVLAGGGRESRSPGRRILIDHAAVERIGVLSQDGSSLELRLTWVGPELDEPETLILANPNRGRLAAGTSDPDGNVYYLLISEAPRDRAEGVEVRATLHKADAAGKEQLSVELDVLRSGLNVFNFDRGDLAAGNLRFSKGVLGLILPRTMHRSPDGLRHQGAIAVTFSAKDLSQHAHLGQTSGHSKANYLTVNDKGAFLALDLGDNYPRGVHLHEITKANITSRLVFTFKTAHATSARNGSPVYDEISGNGNTFYRWSNDNGVYTELGGIVEGKSAYSIVFATDRSLEGKVLDNGRAFRGCDDPRNLAMVRVLKSFGRAPSGSEVSDAIMVDLPRKPVVETGGYYDFSGGWRKQRTVGVRWLTDYPAGVAAHAPQLIEREDGTTLVLWERSESAGSRDGGGLRGMILDEDGEVSTPEFSLGGPLHLNRQDRTLIVGGRAYLLAGEPGEGASRLYHVSVEGN